MRGTFQSFFFWVARQVINWKFFQLSSIYVAPYVQLQSFCKGEANLGFDKINKECWVFALSVYVEYVQRHSNKGRGWLMWIVRRAKRRRASVLPPFFVARAQSFGRPALSSFFFSFGGPALSPFSSWRACSFRSCTSLAFFIFYSVLIWSSDSSKWFWYIREGMKY